MFLTYKFNLFFFVILLIFISMEIGETKLEEKAEVIIKEDRKENLVKKESCLELELKFSTQIKENLKDLQSNQHLELTFKLKKLINTLESCFTLDPTSCVLNRNSVAFCHYTVAKLHLSSIFPVFEPKINKNTELNLVYQSDWLIELVRAIDEDYKFGSFVYNPDHYLPLDMVPLNLSLAFYHLNQAAKLGHSSSQSLVSILSTEATLGLSYYQKIESSKNLKTVSKFELNKIHPNELNPNENIQNISYFISDWLSISYIYNQISSTESIASMLFLANQINFGIGPYSKSCQISKTFYQKSLFQIIKYSLEEHIPSPEMLWDEENVLLEQIYTSQSMGSYTTKKNLQKQDIIQYHSYYAESDKFESQNILAILYLLGCSEIAQNYQNAFQYFQRAHQAGYYESTSYLAYMYHLGLGMEAPNYQKALELYTLAAHENEAFALMQLGLIYIRGDKNMKVIMDVNKGIQFLTKAADKGQRDALYYLGLFYLKGFPNVISTSFKIDIQKANSYLFKAFSLGHLHALYHLNSINCEETVKINHQIIQKTIFNKVSSRAYDFYLQGHYDKAYLLYNLIGNLGDTNGLLNAAWINYLGLLDSKNNFNLNDIYNNINTNPSMTNLLKIESINSLKNLFKPADSKQEFDFFDMDTQVDDEQEDFSFFTSLKPKNNSRLIHVIENYKLAALQGSAEAFLKLGDFYYYGLGTFKNLNLSFEMYLQASQYSHSQASFNLGYMYQFGDGVQQDFHLAKRYYDIASQNSKDAKLPVSLSLSFLSIQEMIQNRKLYSWENIFLFILILITFIGYLMKACMHFY